jgi:small subunit ribosomal protein S1
METEGRDGSTQGTPRTDAPALVRGHVSGVVKGGFEVLVGDERAFCANSHIALGRIDDPSAFLGQELDFHELSPAAEGRRRALSRRRILADEERRRRQELRRRVVPGAELTGRVVRLAAFGAFVDLGGFEGLVHVSEVAHEHISDPAERLVVGQEVRARVLRVEGGRKIALSLKALEADPWQTLAQGLSPWSVVEGRLTRVAPFGAFLELGPGVEGLLHADELPRGALPHLEEAAKARRRMAVVVVEIDRKRRRVELVPAPPDRQPGDRIERLALRRGEIVTGRVAEVGAAGVLVRLGPGQLGLIAHPEMGTPRGTDHAADFPPGTEISGEVLGVEGGGRRAHLSRKRALRREERAEVERHMRTQTAERFPTLGDLLRQAQEARRGGARSEPPASSPEAATSPPGATPHAEPLSPEDGVAPREAEGDEDALTSRSPESTNRD